LSTCYAGSTELFRQKADCGTVEYVFPLVAGTNNHRRTGEYFVQKFHGCWTLNDIPGSRYFARYVVGQFQAAKNLQMMLDPFDMAIEYVDAPIPRQLQTLLDAASIELMG
jgi:hypothetical protein